MDLSKLICFADKFYVRKANDVLLIPPKISHILLGQKLLDLFLLIKQTCNSIPLNQQNLVC